MSHQQRGELSRAQTLRTLDNICLSVQPMHRSESWAHMGDDIVMRRTEFGGRFGAGPNWGGARPAPLTPKGPSKENQAPSV